MSDQETTDRIMPHSIEAEQAVLGSLLINPSVYPLLEGLKPSDFYRKSHQLIFYVMVDQLIHRKTTDIVLLSQAMKDRGELDLIGGRQYITDLALAIATTANAGYYAQIIKEKKVLRDSINFAVDLIADCHEACPPAEIAQRLQTFGNTVTQYSEVSALETLDTVLDQAIERVIQEAKGEKAPGITTGFAQLDEHITGFHPQELVTIGGDSGMGKSTIALQMALAAAMSGVAVGYFSFEMPAHELALKIFTQHTDVFMSKLRDGRATAYDIEKLKGARAKLAKSNLYIEQCKATVADIRAKIRRMKQKGVDVKEIWIDYLQLMEASKNYKDRQEAMSEISRDLKLLAMEENVAVIALVQLNNDKKTRQNKRPILTDVRESGTIVQNSNVVLFVYRDEYYNPETCYKSEAEIIIAKHRMAKPGKCVVHYSESDNRYYDTYTKPERERLQEDFTPPPEDPPAEESEPELPPMPETQDCMEKPVMHEITKSLESGQVIIRCLVSGETYTAWDEKKAAVMLDRMREKAGDNWEIEYVEAMTKPMSDAKLALLDENYRMALAVEAKRKATPQPAKDWRSAFGLKA